MIHHPIQVAEDVVHKLDQLCLAWSLTLNHLPKPMVLGPRCEKTCLRGFVNNTGADQPAHPRSLISAFAIRFLESNIFKLATGEISII